MPALPDNPRRDFLLAAGALGAAAVTPAVVGQNAKFPNKQIRIVVAFPPGGLTDAYARQYADFLSPKLPSLPALVEQGVEVRLVGLEGGLALIAPSGTPSPCCRPYRVPPPIGPTQRARPSCARPLPSPTSRRNWQTCCATGRMTLRCGSSWRWIWASISIGAAPFHALQDAPR